MRAALIILLCMIHFFSTGQFTCPCTAGTHKPKQQRSGAKHVKNYDDFVLKQDTIDVKYMYKWETKFKNKTKTISITPTNPASKRRSGTPEDTLYILKGFLWFISQEGNDCDFHIEIGTTDTFATRMIVEVTKENTDLQKKIREELSARNLKILDCNTSSPGVAHYDSPLPVIVIGLGFYDKSHKPNTNHGDIHCKKFSWELHPVKDIIFQ